MKNTKTLYVKPEAAHLFREATILVGQGNLSSLIAQLLGDWLDKEDPKGTRRKAIRNATAGVNKTRRVRSQVLSDSSSD